MRTLLASVAFLPACQSTMLVEAPACPPGEVVDDTLPFTAADLLALAEVTYDATSDPSELLSYDLPEPLPVHAEVTFEVVGDAVVVDLGTPENEACLAGLALRVPVSETRRGTVNGWAFEQTIHGFDIVATSPVLEALTVTIDREAYDFESDPSATVDPELAPPPEPCQDEWYVSAGGPHDPWAGSWGQIREIGGISHVCGGSSRSLVHWGEYPEGYNPFGTNPHAEDTGGG